MPCIALDSTVAVDPMRKEPPVGDAQDVSLCVLHVTQATNGQASVVNARPIAGRSRSEGGLTISSLWFTVLCPFRFPKR